MTLTEPALDKAMQLFWIKGFFNTSIDDLVTSTGMNRTTIYKHFNGKNGLFIAVLQRFKNNITQHVTKPLHDIYRGVDAIKDFFNQFAQHNIESLSSYGCLLIATASDIPSHTNEVTTFIQNCINDLKVLFTNILNYAASQSCLRTDVDIPITVDFLVANVIAIMTLFRAKCEKQIVYNQIGIINGYVANLHIQN